jgi:hypothetical protein
MTYMRWQINTGVNIDEGSLILSFPIPEVGHLQVTRKKKRNCVQSLALVVCE